MSVTSLEEIRKARSPDSRDWSVVDALREALRRVESGEVDASAVYVAFQTRVAGGSDFSFVSSKLNRLETMGLLAQHQITWAMDGWSSHG